MKRKLSPVYASILSLIAIFVVLPCAIVGLLAIERVTSANGMNNFGLTETLETIFTALGING
jgi:hypothetical protein